MPKTAKIEYEKRLLDVQKLIIADLPSSTIIELIVNKKKWCNIRNAKRMLAQARAKWVEYENDDIAQKRRLKIQELKHLRNTLKKDFRGTPGGIRAELAIEREIIKLEGIPANYNPYLKSFGNDDDPPPPIISEKPGNVDYAALSDNALREIMNARVNSANV